jgi:iron-sulfur cluster assembly protein
MATPMLEMEITEKAQRALESLAETAKAPYIRVWAGQACGCGRIGYRMAWESERDPEDEHLPTGKIGLLVDPQSRPYLEGSVLDYSDEPLRTGFVIENPNAQAGAGGCGCGGHH